MNRFYAICPFCKKSIFVEENAEGKCFCAACAHELDCEYLIGNGFVIDITAADEEYSRAQEYFINADFKEAKVRFDKALTYHRNHYLAEYYAALCDIYENEDKPDFDIAHRLSSSVVRAVDMLGLCQAHIQARIDFISAMLSQVNIMFSSHFNKVCDRCEKSETWDVLRDKCLSIADAARELANIDKENLMVFDGNISRSLIAIADIGICACSKVVASHMSANVLDLPTNYQYEKAKSCYGTLLYYAASIDANYKPAENKPDYTANILFDQNVRTVLEKYNGEFKSSLKKYLSPPSELLDTFRKDAKTAVKYSFHTCFKSLSSAKDEQRLTLLTDGLEFCLELIAPRAYTDSDKSLVVKALSYKEAREYSECIEAFLSELNEYNGKSADDTVNKFYVRLYETVRTHYASVYGVYNKIFDKIKVAQNAEYRYYKNFLHNMIYACALALTETVPPSHPSAERVKTLKLGKEITDEFLMLNDYKVEELEQSVKYSDVLDIFNAFDNSLKSLAARR